MERIALGLSASLVAAIALLFVSFSASAEPFSQGPKVCAECHKAEYEVWQGSKHAESFKKVHRSDKAKTIATALGEKSMKRNQVCVQCHYTSVQKKAGDKARPKAGPSCESCHGASSEWFPIHNDYGGPSVKRDQETPEHRSERLAKAAAAGMNWPSDLYGVAENCATCHGLANPNVSGDDLAKMLDNGHPVVPDWELVRYSQGSVRHRFYPPDMTANAELTQAEAAEMFVVGQAAKLVSAVNAMSKSDLPKYKEFQEARAASARDALGRLSAAADFLANPSEESARAFVESIQGQDLSGEVGDLLPSKDSYK